MSRDPIEKEFRALSRSEQREVLKRLERIMDQKEIEESFRELPEHEQIVLLHRLEKSMRLPDDELPTPAQREELERRLKAYKEGTMETRSYDEFRDELLGEFDL
jgi:putative addiction module component (TIGR02574 family)